MSPIPRDVLNVRQLSARTGRRGRQKNLLTKVSFNVSEGEVVALIGESGGGKTQTALSALGLTRASPGVVRGSVHVGGVALFEELEPHLHHAILPDGHEEWIKSVAWWNHVDARLKHVLGTSVGWLFQETRLALIPYWTVKQHFAAVLRNVQRRRPLRAPPDDVVSHILSSLAFEGRGRILERYPEELSGGEAQRVMLGLAILARPPLLVADEPTSSLDPLTERAVIAVLHEMKSQGVGILLISHDVQLVRSLADRVMVMVGGHVIERGTTSEVLTDDPGANHHPYTARLLATERRTREDRAGFEPDDSWASVPSEPSASGLGCPVVLRCSDPARRLHGAGSCTEIFARDSDDSAARSIRCVKFP